MVVRAAVAGTALGLLLAGCGVSGTSAGACAAVTAQLPDTAAPGSTVHVELANLWASCHDQGEGPNTPMDVVELELMEVSTSQAVVATGRADVAQDFTASMDLTIPADATGTLKLVLDGVTLGTVTVSD
jgi:hypothetical protein